MSVFTKVLRAGEGKKVRRLAELVPLIGDLEPEMQGLSDEALTHKTVEFRERLDQGETLDDLLIESYAVVREAAWCWANATSTCSSWGAWPFISGGSPK